MCFSDFRSSLRVCLLQLALGLEKERTVGGRNAIPPGRDSVAWYCSVGLVRPREVLEGGGMRGPHRAEGTGCTRSRRQKMSLTKKLRSYLARSVIATLRVRRCVTLGLGFLRKRNMGSVALCLGLTQVTEGRGVHPCRNLQQANLVMDSASGSRRTEPGALWHGSETAGKAVRACGAPSSSSSVRVQPNPARHP